MNAQTRSLASESLLQLVLVSVVTLVIFNFIIYAISSVFLLYFLIYFYNPKDNCGHVPSVFTNAQTHLLALGSATACFGLRC